MRSSSSSKHVGPLEARAGALLELVTAHSRPHRLLPDVRRASLGPFYARFSVVPCLFRSDFILEKQSVQKYVFDGQKQCVRSHAIVLWLHVL